MSNAVAILDEALDDIVTEVAAHRPERGGALLGPASQPFVTRFVYDPQASTTGSTYRPSTHLARKVRDIEESDPALEFKGILHSHPGTFNEPSSGDHRAFADSLDGAPWLGRLITPIVTTAPQRPQPNEIEIGGGLLSMFVAEHRHHGVHVQRATPHVVPLAQDLRAVADETGGRAGGCGVIEVNGVGYAVGSVDYPGFALQVLVDAQYPFTAPTLLLAVDPDGRPPDRELLASLTPRPDPTGVVPLAVTWDLAVAERARLTEAVRRRRSSHAAAPSTEGASARLSGIVSSRIRSRSVVVVGAGSGGSQTADGLVRSGVGRLALVDPDVVEPANLSRSVYRAEHVGRAKVDALAAHLCSIDPSVTVDRHERRLEDLGWDGIERLVEGADLVVAATDDPHTQKLLNHVSYARGVPAVFGGVYAQGAGGEVVMSVPGLTRCFACSTRGRAGAGEHLPHSDYGSGRLTSEPALGSDISMVVSASLKLAIGLLELDAPESEDLPTRRLVVEALSRQYSYVILSTIPDFAFFPEVFGDTAGQFAYQSVWMGVRPDPRCPVCGDHPVAPASVPLERAPAVRRVRRVEYPGEAVDGAAGHRAGRHAAEPTSVDVKDPLGPAVPADPDGLGGDPDGDALRSGGGTPGTVTESDGTMSG